MKCNTFLKSTDKSPLLKQDRNYIDPDLLHSMMKSAHMLLMVMVESENKKEIYESPNFHDLEYIKTELLYQRYISGYVSKQMANLFLRLDITGEHKETNFSGKNFV